MKIVKAPRVKKGFILSCKQYIPDGLYCYDEKGFCPFYMYGGDVYIKGSDEIVPKYYCHYLQVNTIDFNGHLLLFDAVKECGVNTEVDQKGLDPRNPNMLLTHEEVKKILEEINNEN